MPRSFVIRPFEIKQDSSGRRIDFERIHKELIQPALEKAGYGQKETTTGEIVAAGNIQKDMFLLILEADLVVCDITIHNANVFYELGIRHALRQKHTVLIRGRPTADTTPFDLLADRYLEYNLDEPANSTDNLAEAIEASEKNASKRDSPIFEFVENLPETALLAVRDAHPDFREEVERAKAAKSPGWLRLLAEEVRDLKFRRKGMRVVGRAQWELRDRAGARQTWERVREEDTNDLEANLLLAEIYSEDYAKTGRSELHELSEQAIKQVLDNPAARRQERARALTRRGSNQKTQWRRELPHEVDTQERREQAVNRVIVDAYRTYHSAFLEDPADIQTGIAAFQIGSILLRLSGENTWAAAFDDDDKAGRFKRELAIEVRVLHHLLMRLLEVERPEPTVSEQVAASVAKGELLLLGDGGAQQVVAQRVVKAYENAISRLVPAVHWHWARQQLQLYSDLGIETEVVGQVIAKMDARFADHREEAGLHIVLVAAFHSMDDLPADAQHYARQLIKVGLQSLMQKNKNLEGFAGAGPGVDIIFHEVCSELGVRSTICLPVPAANYAATLFSKHDDWRSRFLELKKSREHLGNGMLELSTRARVPDWLYGVDVDIWDRGNLWLLRMAQARSAGDVTLFMVGNAPREAGEQKPGSLANMARADGTVRIEHLLSNKDGGVA